jgi:hypothetical protein
MNGERLLLDTVFIQALLNRQDFYQLTNILSKQVIEPYCGSDNGNRLLDFDVRVVLNI